MTRVLKDLIELSKDGEWGKDTPFGDSVEMLCVRGTDFAAVRCGDLDSVPRRHVPRRIAAHKTLKPWDLVIETAGGTKGQITGRTLLLRPHLLARADIPVTCASFSRFIRFRSERCDPEFMFWYLQYLYGAGFLHAYHTQHTGVSRFQWTTFAENQPVDLPPAPFQRRIAEILSAYDDLIENNHRRIRILDDMVRALYREWFVEFRFPDHDNSRRVSSLLGSVPEGWDVGRLDDAIVLQRGFDLPTSQRVSGTIPIYAATGVVGFHNAPKARAPGVVTGRSGSIGDVQYVQEDFWPLNTTLWVKEFRKAEPLFAFYLLSTIGLRQFNSGAAVPTLNRNDLHALHVLTPPRALQRRFQDIGGEILTQARTFEKVSENLRCTRELLLPRLLSGQIALKEAVA
jgi:type I restriction enzyme S subunit